MKDGEAERYAKLARQLEPDLVRHALRLSKGNWDWAGDLVQDAIVTGYPLYLDGKLAEEKNLRAWFLRVITNNFINQYNRKAKWETGSPVDERQPSPIDDPERSLDRRQLDGPLEEALSKLPDEQRLCVLLIDVQEFEYAEAAKILQIPIGTVRSRLARGRLRLYTLLRPYAMARGLAT